MRIWDLDPGYLTRASLLGEHRELHGMLSVLINSKKGYSQHPETLRWKNHIPALCKRHQQLVAEMILRGYKHQSPVVPSGSNFAWPGIYIDPPFQQLKILSTKYGKEKVGRIPLPINAQQLWAQHKYSVMARNIKEYQSIGRQVSQTRNHEEFTFLTQHLIGLLREAPTKAGLRNSVQHMWGYVSEYSVVKGVEIDTMESEPLLRLIGRTALQHNVQYLTHSTAIGELQAWCDE